MDLVGFALLGTVTGIGGGTLRDLFLGLSPVFWVKEPAYLVCVGVSCVAFFTAHVPHSRYKILLWPDAVGLALFAVTGAEKAMPMGSGTGRGHCHGRYYRHVRRDYARYSRRCDPGYSYS